MSKLYSFDFNGTKEMFLEQLNNFSFDGYIVKLCQDEIHFGIARGGHSGGYWFIPTITELDNKITLSGTIRYIDPYTSAKGFKKIINKVEEMLGYIILLPLIIVVKVCLFFYHAFRKLLKRTESKEASTEDRLYDLMENRLNCTRQKQ